MKIQEESTDLKPVYSSQCFFLQKKLQNAAIKANFLSHQPLLETRVTKYAGFLTYQHFHCNACLYISFRYERKLILFQNVGNHIFLASKVDYAHTRLDFEWIFSYESGCMSKIKLSAGIFVTQLEPPRRNNFHTIKFVWLFKLHR